MPDLRRYRWIVFDAVGTLIYPNPSVAGAYHTAAQRFGSRLSEDEISRRFRQAFRDSERAGGFVTSEAIERERWRSLVTSVLDDIRESEACFEDLFRHFASVDAWKCFPDVAATLTALQAQGFRLAIASNFDARLNGLCDGLNELRPLEKRIISSEIGIRKPSPQFYVELLRRLDCPPDEVLMVGDDVENDIRPAQAAGIEAWLVSRGSEAPAESLRNLSELVTGGHSDRLGLKGADPRQP